MIFVINGPARTGKDTFVNIYREERKKDLVYTYNISTVDFVKTIAKECGWDGTKDEKNRKFLSDLKQLLIDWGDVPYKTIKMSIDKDPDADWFIHCREPEEIQKFVDRIGAKTILVRSNRNIEEFHNKSDKGVFDYKYDYIIDNNGTIEDLRECICEFIQNIKK